MRLRVRKSFIAGLGCCFATWAIMLREFHVTRGICAEQRCFVVCLPNPVGKFQHSTLRFWSRAIPSAKNNYTIWKVAARRFWALVDTSYVITGHLVSVKPAVFITDCMLLDPSRRFSRPSSNPLQDEIVLLELVSEITSMFHEGGSDSNVICYCCTNDPWSAFITCGLRGSSL